MGKPVRHENEYRATKNGGAVHGSELDILRPREQGRSEPACETHLANEIVSKVAT